MKTIPLHSNDRTMENLTKGILLITDKDIEINDLAKKLAQDKEKILSNTLLCTQINEGILIDRG